MFFAKFPHFFSACCLLFSLVACSVTPNQTEINRSEAVKARINLALAYLAQSDFAKAKENIDKALAHDSEDAVAHSVLAYYYQQLNQTELAEKSYQTALGRDPLQPDILNNYGTFLCKQHRFEAAFQQFEQALNSPSPYYHQAETLENIALCAKQAGELPRFFSALKQLADLAPDKAEGLEKLIDGH